MAGALGELGDLGPCHQRGLPAGGELAVVLEAGFRIQGRKELSRPLKLAPFQHPFTAGIRLVMWEWTTTWRFFPSPLASLPSPDGESYCSPEHKPSHLAPGASPVPRPDCSSRMLTPGMTPSRGLGGVRGLEYSHPHPSALMPPELSWPGIPGAGGKPRPLPAEAVLSVLSCPLPSCSLPWPWSWRASRLLGPEVPQSQCGPEKKAPSSA